MNGAADLGGMMGFGPVIEETNEPNFHADWESRVMGMTIALGATKQWNIDQSRYARESMNPSLYLNSSYYQIWLQGLIKLLKERDLISDEELLNTEVRLPSVDSCRALQADNVEQVLMAGGPADRETQTKAAYQIGQPVRTLNTHPNTHTRLPRYARDKIGVISKAHGTHVFPDTNAQGLGENPTWLYKVSFDATTLWGESSVHSAIHRPNDKVHLDLWEAYLVPA